jgi:hypothetical protein
MHRQGLALWAILLQGEETEENWGHFSLWPQTAKKLHKPSTGFDKDSLRESTGTGIKIFAARNMRTLA